MPAIPLVKSRQSVQGAAGALDRSYSSVNATPNMFGAMEAKALQQAGDAIGSGLTNLAVGMKEYEQHDRNEKVAAAVASNPLAPTALEAQQSAPPDGSGLVTSTTNALRQKIDDDAARLFPNDPKAAQQYKIKKFSEMGHYVTNSAVMEQGTRLEYSKRLTDDALNATANTVRTDPGGYELAMQQGIDVINSSLVIPPAMKEAAKHDWAQRLANTRFEGMLTNAKSVQDLEAIDRELTTPSPDGGANEWQSRLKEADFEKLRATIKSAKNTFASKATTEANAALDKYEKMTADRTAISAPELQQLRGLADNSQNGVVMLRYSRLARDQELLSMTRGETPAQLYSRSNAAKGGASMAYPGLPPEVSGYIGEATQLFPGVSGVYLGATAVREYGANFKGVRTKVNTKFAPVPSRPDVDIANVSPQVRDNLTTAGELFGAPLTVNSGFRSQAKQDAIRFSGDPNRATVAKHSHHTEGSAVDISTVGMDGATKARLVDSLVQAGFTGFGEYDTHIHADMRENVPGSYRTDKASMWGGWTNMSPEVKSVLDKRGYAPGKGANYIDRSGPVTQLRARTEATLPIDYTKGTNIIGPDDNPTSSAVGLYQFTTGKWKDMVGGQTPQSRQLLDTLKAATGVDIAAMSPEQRMALRGNPRVATLVAAASASADKQTLESALGKKVTDAELYMSHFMGTAGATSFLRAYSMDKSQSAVALMPDAAKANKPIYFRKDGKPRTVGEVYDLITARFGADPTMVAYGDAATYRRYAEAKAKGLANNPYHEAAQDGVVTATALGNDSASWQTRGQNVRKIAGYYQMPTEETKPFDSDTEVQALKKQVTDGTSEQVVTLLQNMASMDAVAPGSMTTGLEQLGHKNSAYGVAGDLMLRGDPDNAIAVVQGSKTLANEKSATSLLKQDGGGKTSADVWNERTRSALNGVPSEYRAALYQAANAHYVTTYAPNVKDFKPDLYAKSIQAVMGGKSGDRISEVNGEPTVLPNGVTGTDMDTAVNNITADDIVKYAVDDKGRPANTPAYYSNGDIVQPYDIAVQAKLEYVGADTYRIRMSDYTYLLSPRMSPHGRPYQYLIKMDAKAVAEINSRPRDRERTQNLIGDPQVPWTYPFASMQ